MKFLTTTLARCLFAASFFIFGVWHIFSAASAAGMLPNWLPGGSLWVYLTGICFAFGGVSIFTQKNTQVACNVLAAVLTFSILLIHMPHMLNPDLQATTIATLLRDVGLLGAVLTWSGIPTMTPGAARRKA